MFEIVPNLSEGRNAETIAEAVKAVETAGAQVLNWSSDELHHRSVLTIVGDAEQVLEAAVALAGVALERIDLRGHSGLHPRIGALDVLPFVPLGGASSGRRRRSRSPGRRPDLGALRGAFLLLRRGGPQRGTPPAPGDTRQPRLAARRGRREPATPARVRSPSARARSSSRSTSSWAPPNLRSPGPSRGQSANATGGCALCGPSPYPAETTACRFPSTSRTMLQRRFTA